MTSHENKEILHLQEKINLLQKDIDQIMKRNDMVTREKSRETSWMRKVAIAVLTYAIIFLFFW